MELKSAAKRILWHAKLIALSIAAGVAISLAILPYAGQAVASTRVLLGGVSDQQHALSGADLVLGIATSETQLTAILAGQGVAEDPSALADRISVRPVGDSGVVQISVSDPSAVTAARLADAVTHRVVSVMRSNGLFREPLPRIIQSASGSTRAPGPTNFAQVAIVGALAGLILGLLVAALLETFSPTMVGREAIGDQFHVPVLEVLPRPPGVGPPTNLSWLRWQLEACARSGGVTSVELVSVGRRVNLAALAERLDLATPDDGSPPGPVVRPLEPDAVQLASGLSAGLVVVVPKVVKLGDIRRARELADVTGWPLVGVVAYEPSRHGVLGMLFTTARDRDQTTAPTPKVKQVA